MKFFLCHCMFSAYCLFHCGIIQLCYLDFLFCCFSPQIAFCCSYYCELLMTVHAALLPVISGVVFFFFFLWINKLLLPLCSCLFVSMVHLHVSFGITVGGVFLTALFITTCGGGSSPVPDCVISC